jgi:hypothetical protein
MHNANIKIMIADANHFLCVHRHIKEKKFPLGFAIG